VLERWVAHAESLGALAPTKARSALCGPAPRRGVGIFTTASRVTPVARASLPAVFTGDGLVSTPRFR
jgi:hypothetical protein